MLSTFSVLVDVRVVCEDCGTHAPSAPCLTTAAVTVTPTHTRYDSMAVTAIELIIDYRRMDVMKSADIAVP